MNYKNPHAKSCVRVYNDIIQNIVQDPTTLLLEGVTEVDCGCSLTLKGSSVEINRPGLYHLSADIEATFGADVPKVQFYLGNDPLLSAEAKIPTTAADFPIHIETEVCITPCCQQNRVVSLKVSGGEAKITRVSVGVLKLA